MKYIGAHVSAAGGPGSAPEAAGAIGASGFALFTKNQRQWTAPPLTAEECERFRRNCDAAGYRPEMILPHDSYLINLCQPDPVKRRQSYESFTGELRRCRELGLTMLNFHPGSHLRLISEAEGIKLIGEAVKAALAEVPGVCAVFENTAGQGSNLGYTTAQLADMLEASDAGDRVGVCVDTCHAFASGYDLSTEAGFDAYFAEFDRLIGRKYLRAMHLNDAKGVCGCKVDRHAPLGDGEIGWYPFERIAADPAFDGIPLILETPEPERWPAEIARLRQLAEA